MAAKKIISDWSETGKTVYTIIRREADGYRLNDADGTFAAAPADPYLLLTEDSFIKGRYEVSEARTVWTDGRYTVAIYKQAGGSPAPVSDTIIGTGELWIVSDSEVAVDNSVSSRLASTDYTAPDNAGIAANGVAISAIQGDIASVLNYAIAMSKWKNNRLARIATDGITETWVLYDDDSTTPMLTWTNNISTRVRTKAT